LTIYNQDFAVIRTPVDLDLHAGTTEVSETNVTAEVEPDSVVLRDVTGRRPIHILEQNYDGSLRVQAQMLAKFEGKTIQFGIQMSDGSMKLVPGKIIRAGYVPQFDLLQRYGRTTSIKIRELISKSSRWLRSRGRCATVCREYRSFLPIRRD
jgi:hypothetical protein